jgi:hypothetical protein
MTVSNTVLKYPYTASRVRLAWKSLHTSRTFSSRRVVRVKTPPGVVDQGGSFRHKHKLTQTGVNGTLYLTRVGNNRQFESDPPGVVAALPASGKNGGQTFSPSLVFVFAVCGLAMMPARRLSLSR